MFGKLLKYELKSVGKWYLTLNAAVLLVSIILGLVLKALGGNFSTDTNSTSAQIFHYNTRFIVSDGYFRISVIHPCYYYQTFL